MLPGARLPNIVRALGAVLLLACVVGVSPVAEGAVQGASAPSSAPAPVRISEEGPRWAELSVPQKSALKPLEGSWASLDAQRKRKWLDLSTRLPRLSPEERARIQTRMADWAAMTPAQRAQARVQFKEAEQVAPKGRQAQWEAYQALSAEQKRQLAGRAARGAASAASGSARTAERGARAERTAGDATQQKSNIVPNPALAARPKAVAPVVVQASPGATTTLLSKRATPPAHQQAGLPKIAGSANFVDQATLLPRRGPQGAAVTAAVASAPLPRP